MKHVLIALAVVMVGLGLWSRPLCASSTKCQAYRATLKSDLKNLGTAQQDFHDRQRRYAKALSELPFSWASAGVELDILTASATGLLVEARHQRWPWGRCVMAGGTLASDTLPNFQPVCTGRVR